MRPDGVPAKPGRRFLGGHFAIIPKTAFGSVDFSLRGFRFAYAKSKPRRLKSTLLGPVAMNRPHSTQSAIKIFVSCGALPLRLEAHTKRLPSEENMGKASKSG